MLPVIASSANTQWPACTPLDFWSMARPQAICAGFDVAYTRAASRMRSASMPQIPAAFSTGMSRTRSASWSKP